MTVSLAPQPNRSTNSITLSLNFLSIPCSVYTGTESVSVARREFVKDTDHAVGRVSIDKVDGTVVERADVIKKAEATSGVMVDLDDDEIAAVTTDRGLATIEAFIPVTKLGQYLTEGLLQLRAKRVKGKTDPGGNKALTVLFAAMKAEKVAALISVAMRGPARYAILTSNGDLRFVVTADCIRQPLDLPDATCSPDEVAMGQQLIKMVGKSTPTLIDTTARQIQAYVDSKAEGQPVIVAETPAESGIDVMAQIMASIEATKQAKAS